MIIDVYKRYRSWIANGLAVLAIISMLSPHVASVSVTPWIAFAVMNLIFLQQSIETQNRGWMFLCMFGTVWDVLIVVQRLTHADVFYWLHDFVIT